MHKAITIIQFKLEGEIIRRRPEFEMDDRMLLHHIDLKRGVVHIDGKDYTLKDTNWPTLDPKDPYRLSIEEEDLIRKILHSFESSEKMKKHMRCFFRHGGMYQVCNSNLLFHASIPMNPDGTFKSVRILGQNYKGRALLDRVDQLIRTAYLPSGENAGKVSNASFVINEAFDRISLFFTSYTTTSDSKSNTSIFFSFTEWKNCLISFTDVVI